ncbi:MAG TPA: ABC transporter ATP-binding protein [Synergistaceae bacterium]|jgi:branched-chain amino acid transport system ATP-binding protein|nr:MAG: Amino acid/amide ABC transporter ATP-binding protein 2, HAAT family [Synergistales bacterium 53_16]KUL00641.1 MAG: Amino acid/amide ABC transporter ATP-binding protein 2, HAAT family [Synergistales bacterium 54_9]MDK2845725.1 branched-chain amino acid transport system ATP-binding protein [Synergistales bacterium]HAA47561.1 ABC transporter ATP-binding protein [Synergistaceae bacterium]MDN5335373.1 branched-chain amino acid transport system ATP-binding protein [Synergistales bacterium]
MLNVRDLHVHYGGIHALKGISIDVPSGKIVTLIGANGAGKSTTLRTIAGLVRKSSGEILYEGKPIDGWSPEDVVKAGIVMGPEGRRIFPHLSVLDNLMLGAYSRNDKDGIERDLEWVYELFPRLKERLWQKGGTLSGGEQQMLAVGRALMSSPKLVMLDEPSLGLAPLLVKEVFEIIETINQQGKTVLLVEQNAFASLKIAHYAYVLEVGQIVLEGTGQDLLNDKRVQEAYLGG